MTWKIVDGRHRYRAALMRGHPTELRCDAISETGHALRVLPISELEVDDAVQLDFAYRPRHAERIAREWNDRLVGVLTVVNGNLSAAERAEIKLGLDKARRHVDALESFLISCEQGTAESLNIVAMCDKHGFEIGNLSGGKPYNRIKAVSCLQAIYRRGPEYLDRTLALAQYWRDEPQTNTRYWLEALYLLVRDGYDELVTPAVVSRWESVVPLKQIRVAKAEAAGLGANSNDKTISQISYRLADGLRKRGKLRKLPLRRPPTSSGGPAQAIHGDG